MNHRFSKNPYLIIISLALAVSSCAVTKATEQELTIIGRNCGMCRGTCFKGYQITGDTINVVEAASSDKLAYATLTKGSADDERQFRELLELLPSVTWPSSERIGCPDCHDQCGIYVYISKGSKIKTVMIDPDAGAVPKELAPFVTKAKMLLWK
jgi:hypothetical protein